MSELGKLETSNYSSFNDIANYFKNQSNTYPSTVEYKLLEMLCNKVKDLEDRFNKLTESKESPVTNYQNKVIEKIETDKAMPKLSELKATEVDVTNSILFPAPTKASTISINADTVDFLLQSLSNEERAEILCNYCASCGKYDPECECDCHH